MARRRDRPQSALPGGSLAQAHLGPRAEPGTVCEEKHGPLSSGALTRDTPVSLEKSKMQYRAPLLHTQGHPGHPSASPQWREPHLNTTQR